MKFDPVFEWPEDQYVAVPDVVRRKMLRILKSTTAILVEERTTGTSTARLNKIGLSCKHGHMPSDSVDDICESVMRIVHLRWQERAAEVQDDAYVLPIRIVCYHTENGKPVRPSFQYEYSPNGKTEENDELTLEHYVLNQLLDQSMRSVEDLRAYTGDLHSTILALTERNSTAMGAMGTLMNLAATLATAGMHAQENALRREWDITRLDRREEARASERASWDKRIDKALSTVAPFIDLGVQQFVAHVGKRKAAQQSGGVAPADGEEQGEDGDEDEEIEHPMAAVCQVLGGDLKPAQIRELARTLTKVQLDLLYDALCSETDEQALERIGNLQAKLGMEKVPALLEILTEEQQRMVMGLFRAAQTGGKKPQ